MPPPTAADPVPPYSRSSHVLRPHHILLLYIFYFGFYSLEDDENAPADLLVDALFEDLEDLRIRVSRI